MLTTDVIKVHLRTSIILKQDLNPGGFFLVTAKCNRKRYYPVFEQLSFSFKIMKL
jgi:hypothetical protein